VLYAALVKFVDLAGPLHEMLHAALAEIADAEL